MRHEVKERPARCSFRRVTCRGITKSHPPQYMPFGGSVASAVPSVSLETVLSSCSSPHRILKLSQTPRAFSRGAVDRARHTSLFPPMQPLKKGGLFLGSKVARVRRCARCTSLNILKLCLLLQAHQSCSVHGGVVVIKIHLPPCRHEVIHARWLEYQRSHLVLSYDGANTSKKDTKEAGLKAICD